MKKILAVILQCAVLLVGAGVLTFLLWEPHLEGRNAHATVFQIYFNDPFLAFVYVGSIPFFVALYQAYRLLGNMRRDEPFSQVTVMGLRRIQRCAMILLGVVAVAVIIILATGDGEDRPGGIAMSGMAAITFALIAIGAASFARNLTKSLNLSADARG